MSKRGNGPVYWRETQKAWDSPWWRLLGIGLGAVIAAPGLWRVVQHLVWGVRWGGNRMSDFEFALTSGFTFLLSLAVVAMVYWLKMTTEVTKTGIRVSFSPPWFGARTVTAGDIVKAEARIYRPILEYGGWGIRWGFGGSALTLRGKGGVQLTLAKGRRLLVGSQRPAAFQAALSRLIKSKA